MARIRSREGVASVWTDHGGSRLVVFMAAGAKGSTADEVAKAMGPRARRLSGPEEEQAIAAARGGRWSDRPLELSVEEAGALARRAAAEAATLGLDAAQCAKVEDAVRRALVRVFERHAARRDYDPEALHRDVCEEVEAAISSADLPPEAMAKLRQAIEKRRRAQPVCKDPR